MTSTPSDRGVRQRAARAMARVRESCLGVGAERLE